MLGDPRPQLQRREGNRKASPAKVDFFKAQPSCRVKNTISRFHEEVKKWEPFLSAHPTQRVLPPSGLEANPWSWFLFCGVTVKLLRCKAISPLLRLVGSLFLSQTHFFPSRGINPVRCVCWRLFSYQQPGKGCL